MKAIETVKLTKTYGDTVAVDSLDLTIEEGEFYSLLGVNGAGKTTTIRMLCCLAHPTSGDATLLGDSVLTDPQAVKAKINLSPQETAIAPNLTVRENLMLIAGIYGEGRLKAAAKASEMIETFHLGEVETKLAKRLSGGMQRRLSVAMALISEPRIIFLDEPTLGLDVLARREFWNTMRELRGKITIVLTTHYLEEAEAQSDRIGIMHEGKLLAVGPPAELKSRASTSSIEDAFIHFVEMEAVR